jgi:hypothetical protein
MPPWLPWAAFLLVFMPGALIVGLYWYARRK